MAKVLGRVIDANDQPRGPDVEIAIEVPPAWLARAATVAITLPRNLQCARCHGGGCDSCGRAGAVSLRGRRDPEEVIEVILPASPERGAVADAGGRPDLMLRIPQRGGLSADEEQPRGHLMLQIRVAAEPSSFVECVAEPDPSDPPREAEPKGLGSHRPRYSSMPDIQAGELLAQVESGQTPQALRAPGVPRFSVRPAAEAEGRGAPVAVLVAVGAVLLLLLWLLLQ